MEEKDETTNGRKQIKIEISEKPTFSEGYIKKMMENT